MRKFAHAPRTERAYRRDNNVVLPQCLRIGIASLSAVVNEHTESFRLDMILKNNIQGGYQEPDEDIS
jgi:hypothetical protein